jgi:hypothetical protein
VRDVIAYDAHGARRCTGDDCTPASHDLLASFRVELRDLLYLSLNLGFVPADMPETVRAVGAAVGIDRAEIERLVGELGECVRRYRLASRRVPGGAWFFDEGGGDAVRHISWRGGLLAD